MKRCPRCTRALPLDAFYKSAGKRDGRSTHCIECNRSRYAALPYEARNKGRVAMYGLTAAEYQALVESCGNRCQVCNAQETVRDGRGGVRTLSVDHCHETGKVRGLLCSACNQAIGHMGDDPDRLEAAAAYLEQHAAAPRLFTV